MKTAVVLMAYGSPDRLDDVPAYYADIRGGRPIAAHNLEDLVGRYRRLGIEQSNPLNAITEETRASLEAQLGAPVFTGMKHWTPHISEAAELAVAGEAELVVGLVLAPDILDHLTALDAEGTKDVLVCPVGFVSDHLEIRWDIDTEAAERAVELGIRLERIEMPNAEPRFVGVLAEIVRSALAPVPASR